MRVSIEVVGTVGRDLPWLRVVDAETGTGLGDVKSVELLTRLVRVTQFERDGEGRFRFIGPETIAVTVLETSDVEFVMKG